MVAPNVSRTLPSRRDPGLYAPVPGNLPRTHQSRDIRYPPPMNFLLVFLGGGLGSCLRYAARLGIESSRFPYSTLAVNIVGSCAAGWILHLAFKEQIAPGTRLFLMTGILGGFTTFSAFSAETIELVIAGRAGPALVNVLVSLASCLGAAWLGFRIGGGATSPAGL